MLVHLKDLNQETFSWLLSHPCWHQGCRGSVFLTVLGPGKTRDLNRTRRMCLPLGVRIWKGGGTEGHGLSYVFLHPLDHS